MNRQKGSAIGDYLLLTAAIAGVMVPLMMKFFGEPILRTFATQRGRLVEFVAQTPVRPGGKTVPNTWFGQQRQATITSNSLNGGNDLVGGEDIEGGEDLQEGKELRGGRNLKQGRTLRQGRTLKGGATIQSNTLAGGSDLSGANYAGGGGSGLSSNDPDFFNKGGDKSQAATGPGAEGSAGKRATAPSSNFEGGDELGGGRGSETKKDKGDSGGAGAGGEGKSVAAARAKENLMVYTAEEESKARAGKFDWWTIVKVLIVLVILFLLALIAIGNLKKR